jgi:hypothetical protein
MGTGIASTNPGVDFVIVTALEEEREAVLVTWGLSFATN